LSLWYYLHLAKTNLQQRSVEQPGWRVSPIVTVVSTEHKGLKSADYLNTTQRKQIFPALNTWLYFPLPVPNFFLFRAGKGKTTIAKIPTSIKEKKPLWNRVPLTPPPWVASHILSKPTVILFITLPWSFCLTSPSLVMFDLCPEKNVCRCTD
jgi:hypothetical protein